MSKKNVDILLLLVIKRVQVKRRFLLVIQGVQVKWL